MAKPKFNYDSEDFYKEIYALAMQGLNDGEIAYSLGDNLGVDEEDYGGLRPSTFSEMKAGKYKGWTAEENARRGARISEELAHGRARVLGVVRGRYLKAALGGIKIKSKVVRKRYNVVKGVPDMMNRIEDVTESESETAPNIQALANFLYHHDTEFRNIQKGIEEGDVAIKVKNGVSITAWLERENELEKEEQTMTQE